MKSIGKIAINILIILTLIFASCISFNNEVSSKEFINSREHFSGVVIRVVDGDTVYVRSDNVDYNIRLLGVDTPETYQKNNPKEYYIDYNSPISDLDYLKLWGYKVTNYTRDNIENKNVIVVFDRNSPKIDRYGRHLAYIYVDNENFNQNLIKHGFARVYVSDFELKEKFLEDEKNAKNKRIGLWAYKNN
ncbi:nuclease (SNase domain protein) [Methanococcus vannielii SB]|jgi:micrococcal nuclease|uniref:Nuclease (SNase domain protein) n=1 Tax=Methanococcus vannielii (strain ATCC 35089 / DSM 1224 / JCM 13029 / OCM 148 / SB) TaxID=406327 RepID=A6UPK1_METVS|nr:thermonuclease family protein [Methanococcus vannielii]ABR54423.1 nuclease (SNase domain protein) [Methanococcus vannielii SB]